MEREIVEREIEEYVALAYYKSNGNNSTIDMIRTRVQFKTQNMQSKL